MISPMKKLVTIILVLLVVGISPVVSLAGTIEDALERVRLFPYDANAHFDLGVGYSKSSQFQQAIASYKKALKINPNDAGVLNNLGHAYFHLDRYEEAITVLKEAVRLNPDHGNAYYNLAYAYEKLDRNNEAIVAYHEALRINPDDTATRKDLNKLEGALKTLEALNKLEGKTALATPPGKKMVEELDQLARLEKPKVKLPPAKPIKQKPITEKTFLELESLKNIRIKDKNAATSVPLHKDVLENFVELKRDSKEPSEPFCKSGKILPIDCAESDKYSREIWFKFSHTYSPYAYKEESTISKTCKPFLRFNRGRHAGTGKMMRSGNVIMRHDLNRYAKRNNFELLGIEANPGNSFVAISNIKDFKLTKEFIDIEFTRNVQSVAIKYADKEKEVKICSIFYKKVLRDKLAKRKIYEIAHAEAVKSARNFGNAAPSLLQQRSRETVPPSVSFSSINSAKVFRTDAYQIFIRGKVTDNEGVLTLLVKGRKAAMKADGTFASKLKLRIGENKIPVLAEDINGNITEQTLTIIREDFIPEETLADVDIPPKAKTNNPDGIAIVIGVESYQYVSTATYAYNDAEVFREYLADTMGFSKAKVKIVTNRQATLAEFNKLLAPNGWLARNVDPEKSEIVIYFSGHGIPNPKTKQTGLLPFDVDPNYSIGFHLSQLYESLGGLNAKSVTVFLDACFTGENRERKMLLADARGIVPVPSERNIPHNFTVLSAASSGQFSGALKEKEHGLFTYYVLKGLGGDADYNKDKKLTMGELGKYVRVKVKERAAIEGREQTPELQGDPEKILVEW
jgi:tetratricopeptide (TPR) repeat protein